MERMEIRLPPFSIEVDDAIVTVWEVIKTQPVGGRPNYHVVVSFRYRGIESKRYGIDAKDTKDLINKLKIELTKLKMIEYTYDKETLRKVMTQ